MLGHSPGPICSDVHGHCPRKLLGHLDNVQICLCPRPPYVQTCGLSPDTVQMIRGGHGHCPMSKHLIALLVTTYNSKPIVLIFEGLLFIFLDADPTYTYLSSFPVLDEIKTRFDLQNNEIGSEKGKVLVEALRMNTTLTSLNLYGNNLESDIREALAVALIPSLG
ncbi:hypothetical protein C2G38_2173934 [Gigaspora rosea]|uniref:Uncharacterized protein n=1 Tax=Gigaspora rosea TaxID=44941 RepID=A0A397VKX2_9GLOM|nr:hypothetical protein C2G38_2173934 [Gigaspora rosea]